MRREGTVVPEDILGAHSSPSMAESLLDSGNAWYTKGEYKRAMADYDQAVRLDPANPMLYNCRGRAWSAQGEYTKALADFDEAIRREPTLAVAFHHRGNAWENTGEYERAREDHATAGRLDPQYAVLHLAQEMLPSVTTDVAKPVAGTASYTAGG
ncbi:MAG: tetratricopeptide repeat protein [Planctomycetota bacterium]|nr:tetratricopeptide repeat protein [Planctomycetota bacterium]